MSIRRILTVDTDMAVLKQVSAPVETADDDLSGSDLILPPADITFDEASEEFTGDGLIPD